MANETKDLTAEEKEFCHRLLSRVFAGEFDMDYIVDYSRALLDAIEECLSELPAASEAMLRLMLNEGKTREVAAAELGITDPQEAYYYEARGFRMLRHPHRSRRFRPFMTVTEYYRSIWEQQ